jgi:predicted transcriptional regulator
MRTLVDIRDDQIAALDALAKAAKKPRAVIIRTAIDEYVGKNTAKAANDDKSWLDEAFGLWAKRGFKEDGLAYERRLRDEW